MLLFMMILLAHYPAQLVVRASSQDAVANNCSSPWFHHDHRQSQSCKCSNALERIVFCSNNGISVNKIKHCFCMTVEEENHGENTGDTIVGACPYTCVNEQHWYSNGTKLNKKLCKDSWQRAGRLCSRCQPGHGPLVYSYQMNCVSCSSDIVKNSVALLLVSFVPLTVFCLGIITLRVSGARPPMSTFILVSQVMSAPQYLSLVFVPSKKNLSLIQSLNQRRIHNNCWRIFATFFGVWNLDFFRSFHPQMCLSPHMSTLQARFLEYSIALFPLVLLLVVYTSDKLYYRGNRFVFCLFRPLVSCLARIRQTIRIKTSLIDAFATFIILAIVKIGYTCLIILEPVIVVHPNGSRTIRPYVDPNISYFGPHHILYALAALFFTIILIVIPLLLLFLYPLKLFQNMLSARNWQCPTLHIFADTFQGCYKNGTNGGRDYRWFSGLHLLLRFVVILFYELASYYQLSSVFMAGSVSLYMLLLAVFQPYKKFEHFRVDMVLLFGLVMWCTAISISMLHIESYNTVSFSMHLLLLVIASAIPFIYLSAVIIHWLVITKKFLFCRRRQRALSTPLLENST